MGVPILVALLATIIILLLWPAIRARLNKGRIEDVPEEAVIHRLDEMRSRKGPPKDGAADPDAKP